MCWSENKIPSILSQGPLHLYCKEDNPHNDKVCEHHSWVDNYTYRIPTGITYSE